MIPLAVDRYLSERAPPRIAVHWHAYKEWRWGDPLVRHLKRLCDPDKLSIDVGAHTGAYLYFMRRHSARCVAFEPNPGLLSILRARFPRHVEILPYALSNRSGVERLRVPVIAGAPNLGRATIEPANRFAAEQAIEIETRRLDAFELGPVGLIKIDVEGHELEVLSGAAALLGRDRPNLIVEVEDRHRPGATRSVFEHLAALGYAGWFRFGDALLGVEQFDPALHQRGERVGSKLPYVVNFVFSVDPGIRRDLA